MRLLFGGVDKSNENERGEGQTRINEPVIWLLFVFKGTNIYLVFQSVNPNETDDVIDEEY